MKYRDDKSKLGKYIVISLIIHLFLIFFFPFGTLRGVADEGGYGNRDFGFVQFVEIKTEVETKNTATESKEYEKESKKEEKKEEEKPEEKEEVKEENQEKDTNINIEEEDKSQPEEKTEEEIKTEKEEPKTESKNSQEVLTSEESEMEIEKKENTDEETEKQEEKDENAETEEKQEEKPPPPPPPPTAGELVGLSPRPVYPKYLVSEQKTGKVQLNVHVNQDGEVEKVEVIESSGIETMDRNAILTIERGWEFKNYKKAYYIDVAVDYNIDNRGNTKVDVDVNKVTFK